MLHQKFSFIKYQLKQETYYNHIIKRSMFSMACRPQFVHVASRTLLTKTTSTINNQIITKKNASYEVDNSTVLTTNHKQSQENVIIQRNNGQTFQHSSFVRVSCVKENCVHKLCEKPCDAVVERADVGFATHSGNVSPNHKFLSSTDLDNNQSRAQYGKMHPKPIKSADQTGLHKNEDKTNALNYNSQMKSNVHMNSSREPSEHD